MHTRTHIHTCTYTHTNRLKHTCPHTYMHIHTYTHTYTQHRLTWSASVQIYIHVLYMPRHQLIYTNAHAFMPANIYMHADEHTYINTVYTWLHACSHNYKYSCINANMCICCVFTNTQTRTCTHNINTHTCANTPCRLYKPKAK